ncbi:MAG: hypothetical protein Q4C20_16205 [Erysipelotrichaceae bacterium]|jgi:hypothetical protein|nr:hypothetical protein [Erysipelotrichaceae bacterium]
MFVRVIPNNKGAKNTVFCDLVESYRDENDVPRHRIVVKLGQFDRDRIPYLKAAFNKGDPASILEHELKKL